MINIYFLIKKVIKYNYETVATGSLQPNAKIFLGLIKPETISDGNSHILCSGFWGLSRHINYLGEVLMATGITLSLGYPAVAIAWLYPLYYIILLSTRQADDDRRCREKYGPLWEEYEKKTRWRIIPKIY